MYKKERKHYKYDLEFQCVYGGFNVFGLYKVKIDIRDFYSGNKFINNINSMFKTDV